MVILSGGVSFGLPLKSLKGSHAKMIKARKLLTHLVLIGLKLKCMYLKILVLLELYMVNLFMCQ